MLEQILRQSPLAHLGLAGRASDGQRVSLTERTGRAYVSLRFDPADTALRSDLALTLGLELPLAPCSSVTADDTVFGSTSALWLGPDEWLLVQEETGDPWRGARLVESLEETIGGRHASAVDLSHNYACLYLSGPKAAEVLARGCPLDLHRSVFPTGGVAQSHLGRAAITLYRCDDTPGFEVLTRRSFADYVFRYLMDSGRQFGITAGAETEG